MSEAEISNWIFWLKIAMGTTAILIIGLFFYIIEKLKIK
tara:strand:- start:194 stop:310 length:117 start_codon:yes stop_codon:yes gene_type:complete